MTDIEEAFKAGDCPEDCADSEMKLSDADKLEWLWANCSVIHRDVVEQWDIEHCLWRGKDERAFIEAQMPNSEMNLKKGAK